MEEVYISEDLTRLRFRTLLQAKRAENFKSVSTKGGKIFVWLIGSEKPVTVESPYDLKRLNLEPDWEFLGVQRKWGEIGSYLGCPNDELYTTDASCGKSKSSKTSTFCEKRQKIICEKSETLKSLASINNVYPDKSNSTQTLTNCNDKKTNLIEYATKKQVLCTARKKQVLSMSRKNPVSCMSSPPSPPLRGGGCRPPALALRTVTKKFKTYPSGGGLYGKVR